MFDYLAIIIGSVLEASPEGWLTPWRRWQAERRRIVEENVLKHLLQQRQLGQAATFSSIAGALRLSDRRITTAVRHLERLGLLATRGQSFDLTSEGERLALQVVRAHRLWERFLADDAGWPLDRIHKEAERREHQLTPEQVDRLESQLGHPTTDPHGDPIPTRDGEMSAIAATPLTAWPVEVPGLIVHLEDEPPLVYAQLNAEGLRVGQRVRVTEANTDRIVLTDEDSVYRLAPVVAGNVFMAAVADGNNVRRDAVPLSDLPLEATGVIVALSGACRGYTRRRLLDLGFTPGTRVSPALNTFAGDPRGYRVRGTTIALRRDQASHVLVDASGVAS
ncbi:MAG: DtxR family transcriptional regulator [Vicinamibacterales bacterium]